MVVNRRYDQGIALLREAITLDPEAAFSYNALGIAYMEQQRWNEAVENFQAASARAENWVYPHYNLARAYVSLGRQREAEQQFKLGIDLGTSLGMKYSYLHYNLGILYLYQGRVAPAEEQFRRAIEMKPDDAMSYHNLGLIFERKGNGREAEANFRKAAELDPKLVEPRLKLAEIYRKQRRSDVQETILREAVAGDPASPMALETLGRLLLETKKLGDAEQIFTQMLASGIRPETALAGLGDVHTAQGQFEQAAEDYRQAMARTTDRQFRGALEKKLRSVEKKK